MKNSVVFHQGRHGDLSEQELRWAKTAWRYFESQANPATGLTNSVAKVPSTSMWQVGDYLAAMIAAHKLAIITDQELDRRMSTLLQTLNTIPLAFGQLPNKVYNTDTGRMGTYNNQPGAIGWSAIDIGRLLIWLKITRESYSQFAEYVDKAVLRWQFCEVIDSRGRLYGAVKVQDKLQKYQEGRLGYEEYAAMGYQAWGFDTRQASQLEPYSPVKIYGVEIVHDDRDPRKGDGSYAPVVSLPYLLHGLEFNWDHIDDTWSLDSVHTERMFAELAERVYQVQALRYEKEGIFTARTDHQLSQAPFFVYDSIFVAGYAWNTIADNGTGYPDAALVSTGAAFGMWGLWKTEYTDLLIGVVDQLFNPESGWYEGRKEQTGGYENSLTSTTNALVLETLLYKQMGKLYRLALENGYYQTVLNDEFAPGARCLPSEHQSPERSSARRRNEK